MTFSAKRMYAIFEKDLKDLSKNLYVSTTFLLPVVLAFFYRKMDVLTLGSQYLIINLVFVSITFFIQCAVIAEEKEKNTLRGLMLSPASLPEILSGKSLVSLLLTTITLLLCITVLDYRPANIALVVLAFFISSLFYIALGTLVGLLSRTVIEASVFMLPVMVVFAFGPLMESVMENYPMLRFLNYFPGTQLMEIASKVQDGAGFTAVSLHFGWILAWFVGTAILTVFVYRKREMDS